MKQQLDMDKIASGLGARRVGKVTSSGGYFGAQQLAAEVAHLRVPPGGGRATNPSWTERRLIPLSPQTLRRLEDMAARLRVAPLQVAAILLERSVDEIPEQEVLELGRAVAAR